MLSSWRACSLLLVAGMLATIGVLIATASGAQRVAAGAGVAEVSGAAISNQLAVPGVERFDGGQQELDQRVAERLAPGAVSARRLSRTRYEHLSAGAAVDAIKSTVPAVVRTSSGGIGTLPAGVRVSRYLSATSARLDLPGGKHAIVESMTPAATRTASSGYVPVNLALRETTKGFAAENASAPVSIPRELAAGVRLDDSGVSLTPLDAAGARQRGSGRLDGGSVVYSNTSTDTDTAAKPTDTGMEVYDLLRSVESPQQLSYQVGLPQGASLASDGPGSVKVVAAGHTLAVIPAPSAHDAAGTDVPVSTSVSGDRLRLQVDHRSGDYLYPIVVDPTAIEDKWVGNVFGEREPTNWRFVEGKGDGFKATVNLAEWKMEAPNVSAASEWGAILYPTQGESHIYAAKMELSASTSSTVEQHLIIAGAGTSEGENRGVWESTATLPNEFGITGYGVCVAAGCATTGGTAANIAAYWMNTTMPEGHGHMTGYSATVYIAQNNGPAISKDTTKELGSSGERNAFYGGGAWLSPHDKTVALFDASDPGIGVSETQYTVGTQKWSVKQECSHSVQCPPSLMPSVSTTDGGGLPEGERTIEAKALDNMGLSSVVTATIKVDDLAPHEITLSGLPTGNVINDATQGGVKLVAHATDGVTGIPSSGVGSLKLAVDGHEVGAPNGSCSPGPCTATGEWTINGEEFAVGEHTAIVTATDAAGNVQTGSTKFNVEHARPVSFGPGELNPVTGEFDLQETDVSLSTIGTPLNIVRGYDSRESTVGATGAFGAPWSVSLSGAQQLVRLSNGSVTLTSATGAKSMFTALGGGKFASPPGDASLVLSASAGETEYTLQDNGSSTVFKHISGDVETVFRASLASGTSGSESIQYTYESVKGVVEPEEELGPVPAGLSCAPTLNPGCRALTFSYASSTTATGEGASEWGGFTGRLMFVYFKTGEEKEGKVVQVTKTVAQYAYDSKGRLRAEWDPRISPALKTTYGYDAEGHVTVISPPGKESWALTYGTSSTDVRPGRLIKAMRPPTSEALWSGVVLKNTAAPTLSGSAALKVRMAVSNGTWTGAPIAYGYQWLDCNISGVECKAIGGATNANYTPVESDLGHALVAQVTATNGGGSVTAKTSPSAVIAIAGTVQTLPTSSLNAVTCIPGTSECVVDDNKGNAYVSTNVTPGSSTWSVWFGPGTSPGEALACPTKTLCLMAAGERGVGGGVLFYAKVVGGSWTQAVDPGNGADAISCASESFCVEGQNGPGYFRYSTSPSSTSWVLEQQGSAAMKAVYCLSTSFCAMGDSTGKVHVATSTAKIESSAWTESNVDSGTALNGISCTSTTSCVAVDGAGNVLNLTVGSGGEASVVKHDIDGTNVLTAVACSGTSCATVDAHGNVFVSTNSGSTWTTQYELKDDLTSVSCPSSKLCATVDTTGHFLAFDPTGGGPITEGEARPPQPGTTVEYNVPVSGSGAPYSLSSGEASKWAQTDLPVEATAIFPADEPVGWPAPDYRRATVDYVDLSDRLVNVASPGGGIITSEYNSHNDLVRTLTAANRASALKEGSTSAEVAQTLDTQSTYNSEGTELLSTLGPLHTIKRTSGATAKARLHVVYSYDEEAPETGGPYRLVTKVTEGAQISESKDVEVRTTTKSYAGQNDLGWTLREPTATTVNAESELGPELVHSTVYDPNTGKVTETRTPGAGAAEEAYIGYEYSSSFGSAGSGNGQLSTPGGIARDSEGNIWVADNFNNRIEEFSSAGTYIRQITAPGCENEGLLRHPSGVAIDKSGTVWALSVSQNCVVGFTSTGTYVRTLKGGSLLKSAEGIAYSNYNNRLYVANTGSGQIIELNPETNTWFELIGKSGTGNGEFSSPEAIAVDSSGNLYVGDKGRVQKLSATGAYISQFGSGHLNSPRGIALDSKGNILVADGINEDVQAYWPSGAYQYKFGTYGSGSGQMYDPIGVALDGSDDAYVVDSANNRIEKWLPSGGNHKSHGNGGTHGTQTIYYTAGTNGEVSACGNRAEWAGLPCEKRPAAQPETSGLPNLPVTTLTYNLWDEPVASTETVGSATRTNTNVYDEAGRLTKDTVSSSVGTALPSVEYEYNTETGDATKSKSTVAGVTQTLESTYDRRGELSSYKDADGNTASFYYDPYGRLESLNDGKGTQTYSYDTTSGLPTKLVDSAAGTFTATYDVAGNLTTTGYPNGMNVNHTYDSTGSQTGIEYLKTTHCPTGCVWYSQTESPSIHGQALSLSSTFSSQSYTYDETGRLTKAQDTPAGGGCTTRVYAYDVETNIRSLTTRPPGTGGACASSGGTAVNHTYDSANRLSDAGIAYDSFGDVTKLPAGDAGGYELSSAFYADETLASQTQNGQTIGYYLDPSGRNRQIVSTGTTNSTVTYHYAGDGNSPAWTEDTAGKWTRNVYGFEGLVAIQNGGESPVLQIQDLKGSIVGTASLSETATGLISKGDTTEYGVPRTSSPPKYSWQGAAALRTELPSGVIAMGARSYVPEIGRFLQPDPIEGGSANEYSYTYGDPINTADPSGEYTVATPSWVSGFFDEQAEIATEAAVQKAAEEQAAWEEAAEKAREAAEAEEEANVAAAEGYSGGGGKKGKKGKVHPGIAMMTEGSGGSCLPFKRCRREALQEAKEDKQHYLRLRRKREREEREGEIIGKAVEEAELFYTEAYAQAMAEAFAAGLAG